MSLEPLSVSQSPVDKFREYLASRSKPQRFTEQQREMVEHIFSQHDHFSADELYEDLKKQDLQVSRPTVYRTLPKLVDAGLLRCLETGPIKYYEHAYGYPHHYHLQCQKCNAMIEFESEEVERIVREIARNKSFQVSAHTFVIQGLCTKCNQKHLLDLI